MNTSPKARPPFTLSEAERLRFCAEFSDDVLSKLADALFQVVSMDGYTAEEIAPVTGLAREEVDAVLSGNRVNFGIDTLAIIARAMGKRPELVLHDV